MALTLEQLRDEVLALSADQREQLFSSLPEKDEIVPLGLHPAWEAEIERRLADYNAGKTEAIPWEIVEKELDGLDDLP